MPESDTPNPPTATERQEWARLCEAIVGRVAIENRDDGTAGVYFTSRGPCRQVVPIAETSAEHAPLITGAVSALPCLLHALASAEKRAERAEGERDGMYEALGRLVALYESEYDNEPPPARPAWLQDALGGEARKVADARDAAHYDALTREMTRREAAESALAALRARLACGRRFALPPNGPIEIDQHADGDCYVFDTSEFDRDGDPVQVGEAHRSLDAAWAAAEAAAKKEGA